MRRKNPQGAAVIFFETDLKKSQPFDESRLSTTQKQYYSTLSSTEQDESAILNCTKRCRTVKLEERGDD